MCLIHKKLYYSTVPYVLYYSLTVIIAITLHLIFIVEISKIRTFLSYAHYPVPWCLVKEGLLYAYFCVQHVHRVVKLPCTLPHEQDKLVSLNN